jgi:hypothetical protein
MKYLKTYEDENNNKFTISNLIMHYLIFYLKLIR